MDRLKNLLLRLVRDEEGQDLIEYALLATFVSLVAIAGASLLGTALNNWYGAVARMLGYDPSRVEELLYQLVHLTRGGETAKMSSLPWSCALMTMRFSSLGKKSADSM